MLRAGQYRIAERADIQSEYDGEPVLGPGPVAAPPEASGGLRRRVLGFAQLATSPSPRMHEDT
jgi:hypothetical protein